MRTSLGSICFKILAKEIDVFPQFTVSEHLPRDPKFEVKKFFNVDLNKEQKHFVSKIIKSQPLLSIQGPPGTGKTTVQTEAIMQIFANSSKKILVASTTNCTTNRSLELFDQAFSAVENELKCNKPPVIVRLGTEDRLDEIDQMGLKRYNWQNVAKEKIVGFKEKLLKYQEELSLTANFLKRAELTKKIKNLLDNAKDVVVRKARIIFTTCDSCVFDDSVVFDNCFVDEATQSTPIASLMAISRSKHAVIIGDERQLEPFVNDQKNRDASESLMSRLACLDVEGKMKHMLTTQYRMNKKILEWPSETFYGNKLKADKSVEKEALWHKVKVNGRTIETKYPEIVIVDTKKVDTIERHDVNGRSYGNVIEAQVVAKYFFDLMDNLKLEASDFGVIVPYLFQKELGKLKNYKRQMLF